MITHIRCQELSKNYGQFCALDRLTLAVEQGEIFGFLGPNGAGKTTTIRLLMGMLIPTSGRAAIGNLDCHQERAAVKRWVGYLPDTPVFHDYLRGSEILYFVGEMHGLSRDYLDKRIPELLAQHSLGDAADEFAVNYSMGMKRKLGLACAQLHDPQVLILDEPTNGLDPIAAREVQQWIIESAANGKTIFLSTHLLDMAEKICHRVGIIDRGRLLAVGRPAELIEQYAANGTLEDLFFVVTKNRFVKE